MSAVKVRVRGLDELTRAVDKFAEDAAQLEDGHRAVATVLLPGVAQRTPVASGALSVSWEAEAIAGAARVTSSLPYAGVLEYGDPKRGRAARRMVRDTLEAETDAIRAAYEDELARRGSRRGFEVDR